ncbi:hypothetical protein DFJ73DRAFT_773407 [Zopfochytrium polystomum]|nr:hypothetical protein DFJ73DRAFT_773407 [Zopfochytrium polystomum]
MLIDLSIESASPQRSRGLLETKLDLMERIERLLDALNDLDKEREEADMSTSSVGRAGRSDSITNGAGAAGSALSSVRIRVTWDGVPAGPPSLSRTAGGSGSRLSSDLSLSGQICFVIEVERLEGGRGWAVQRTFADFQAAHRAISADSPKARKVPFPTLPSGGSGSGGGAIAIELERWVNLMMTDAVISRSDGMRDLVVPDTHPSRQSTSSTSQQTLPRRPSPTRMSRTLSMSSTTSTASVSSTVSGQMLGVLKSAGSAIKKAAVSTGNAVGSVGGAAASGISGLMGNSGNGDSRSQSPGPGQAPTTSAPRQRSPTRTATLPARSASTASGSPGSLAPERPYSMSLARQRFASDNTAPVPPPIPARPASADAMLAAGNVILDGEPDLDGRVAVPPKPPRLPERPPQLPERPPQLPERPHVHNAAARTSSLASTPAAMADASPRPATPPSSSTPAAPASTTVVRTLTPAELALVLECAFATLEEALNLSDPQQWMRQRGLQVVKTLLRQTYSKTLSQSLQRGFESAVAEDAVAGYLKSTREAMWPPPPPLSAAGTGASLSTSSSSSSPPQQPERTDEDKADTRMAAKRLVIAHGAAVFPGVEAVQTVAGRQNTVVGMTRLLNMVQHRDLNRGLMCQLLEALVKSVLSADNN